MKCDIRPYFAHRVARSLAWLPALPVVMLSLIVWSSHLHAQTGRQLFVSPSGNDANPGTELQPFRTIQRAANVVNAGDTVIVEDGTYTASGTGTACAGRPIVCLTRGGSAGSVVTFRARHVGGAKLSGQNNTNTDGFVFLAGANYVTIEGFELYGVGNASGSSSGFELYNGGHHAVISHNNIHDIGRLCTSTSNGEVGIFIQQPGVRVEGNRIHDIGRFAPGENGCSTSNSYYQNHDHGVYVDGESGGSGIPGAGNAFIANNVFYNNARGWSIQVYPGTIAGLSILNNTFAFANPYQDGHIILGAATSNGRITNNIFYNPRRAAINYYTGAQTNLQVTENLVYNATLLNTTPSGTLVASNQVADPLFTNVSSPYDFHPKTGSPAINAGITLVEVPVDISGAARSDGLYDVGAYEKSGSAPSPTPNPGVAAPVITPNGGAITGPVSVTMSTTTAGAQIRYTLNGTAPGSTSPVYGGPFVVSTSLTVRAQAVVPGMVDSPVSQATFQLQQPAAGTLPAGWATRDIGAGLTGSASASGSTFTLKGSGADIWGTADAFRFAYRTLSGDGQLVARVKSVGNTHPWAKAGVMVRASLNANAPFAMMLVSAGKGSSFQWRNSAGASAASVSGGTTIVAPHWIKIVRAGSVLRGYQSSDGVTWKSVGSATIPMSASVTIGLAVTSHDSTKVSTATFESVK